MHIVKIVRRGSLVASSAQMENLVLKHRRYQTPLSVHTDACDPAVECKHRSGTILVEPSNVIHTIK